MADLFVNADPAEVGFDPERLDRIRPFFAQRYVENGLLPGFSVVVARQGSIVHSHSQGMADVASGRPFEMDSIVRIYSMTKAITSVAVLQCLEEGRLLLTDPISAYLPALWNLKVHTAGSAMRFEERPAQSEPTIQDLLRHTAGFTYGWHATHPVDTLYRREGIGGGGHTNAEMIDRLGRMPLMFDPGTRWRYSVATDVLGALLEVIDGQPLDEVLARRVTEPLGMDDTRFWVDDDRADRFATNYVIPSLSPFGVPEGASGDDAMPLDDNSSSSPYRRRPTDLSGGGGMVGTLSDYWRFCEMLRRGGELDGVRILGRPTVNLARRNHLPGNADMASIGTPTFGEVSRAGMGFGLGFSVCIDPAKAGQVVTPGEFAWGGAASTLFWIDPVEDITVVALTQLMPSGCYPIREQLRSLVYGSLL